MTNILKDNSIILIDELKKEVGYVSFEISNNILDIMHTVVKEEYQGKGYASLLIKEVIEYAKKNNYYLHPKCSYAVNYFIKHPEYNDLIK